MYRHSSSSVWLTQLPHAPVVPSAVATGSHMLGARTCEKKTAPVASSTTGVICAATPQPNVAKMERESSIITSVTAPVALENVPMKLE